MAKIILEVFDDGQHPVTCARWFGQTGTRNPELCQHLMSEKFGTVFACGIFKDPSRTRGSGVVLEFRDQERQTGLMPCRECLEARAQYIKLTESGDELSK